MDIDLQVADSAVAARSGRRPRLRLATREKLLGIALIAPVGIVFLGIIVVPLVRGMLLGFYRVQQITLKTQFLGVANFAKVLTDGEFLNSLWITLEFTVGGLVLQVVIGLAVAMLLNQRIVGRSAARSLMIFPYLVPAIVSATVWRWLLNDTYGIVNSVMMNLGIISRPIAWFAEPNLALPSVIVVSTWRAFPFIVIAALGRLQNIPRQLYDAARADGASTWAQFWDITLPQLRSVLVISVFLRFIWNFNDFSTVALLTGGGPVDRTMTLPMLIYRVGFGEHLLGPAAAVADLGLIVMSVFFAFYFWIAKPLSEAPS